MVGAMTTRLATHPAESGKGSNSNRHQMPQQERMMEVSMANSTVTDYPDYSDYSYEYVTISDGGDDEDSILVAVPTLYFLLFLVGLGGNGLVLLVLGGCRGRRRVGGGGRRLVDTFVVHLAGADLLFVAMLPLWGAAALGGGRWVLEGWWGYALCRLSSYVLALNRVSSVALLTCMSAERYLAVVRRLDSGMLRSGRCVRVTCGILWTTAALVAAPALKFRHLDDLGVCSDPEDSDLFQWYALALLVFFFVLPVGVMVLCYGAILRHLQRHCGPHTLTHNNASMHARRTHTLKMVVAILAAFIASWLPFAVCRGTLSLAHLARAELEAETEEGLKRALLISSCLAFVNSCANPIIYLLLDRTFRRRTKLLAKACLGGRPLPHDSLTSQTSQTQDSLASSTVTVATRSTKLPFPK
ncbi:probable G-protein coupled receptor 25 [Engraulis encrasicolus]|uniref:probable G-protein coupled receptor 25 n=1 Tax=Engraulis encrasicolus TaxID=184585 RepID=UPI002FD76630